MLAALSWISKTSRDVWGLLGYVVLFVSSVLLVSSELRNLVRKQIKSYLLEGDEARSDSPCDDSQTSGTTGPISETAPGVSPDEKPASTESEPELVAKELRKRISEGETLDEDFILRTARVLGVDKDMMDEVRIHRQMRCPLRFLFSLVSKLASSVGIWRRRHHPSLFRYRSRAARAARTARAARAAPRGRRRWEGLFVATAGHELDKRSSPGRRGGRTPQTYPQVGRTQG